MFSGRLARDGSPPEGATRSVREGERGGRARLPARPLAVSRRNRSRANRRHEGGSFHAGPRRLNPDRIPCLFTSRIPRTMIFLEARGVPEARIAPRSAARAAGSPPISLRYPLKILKIRATHARHWPTPCRLDSRARPIAPAS